MTHDDEQARAIADAYDEEAEATGWYGPEVAFGLAFKYLRPGQSILDLGIGTGLAAVLFRQAGLRVYGMDLAPEMLAACRGKGFTDLVLHDLTVPPYPFPAASLDHAVCVGTLNFIRDLTPAFQETARILRDGGVFVFAVGDRDEDEPAELEVGPEHTGTGSPVTMYRHSGRHVEAWLADNGFTLLRTLAFAVPIDREKTSSQAARAYLARKGADARGRDAQAEAGDQGGSVQAGAGA
jgi:SAM-dependent methyltransferase